jgi:hypothetical protein
MKAYVDEKNDFHYNNGEGDITLTKVHHPSQCAGRPCVIHNPSDHHMRDWPLNWRQYDGLLTIKPSHFERICQHGIGHPDPDDLAFHASNGDDYVGVHGCDGCCKSPHKSIQVEEPGLS